MQSDHKQVYKLTSQRTGKSEQMYKDLGNFVFTDTMHSLKRPTHLILKLKGIGSWHLRKKRMEIIVAEQPHRLDEKVREDFYMEVEYIEYLNKKEQYLIFVERLKDYEKYISLRNELRNKRHETTSLLEPNKGED